MNRMVFALFTFFSLFAFSQQSYIRMGDAKAKKSVLAFPYFNNLGSTNTGAVTAEAAEIYNTAKRDLELSTYFQMMANAAFLEDPAKTGIKPVNPKEPNGFKFEPLKAAGAEFLIRTGYSVINSELVVEMFLYHIPQSTLVVGKRYKSPVSRGSQIAHTMANDILEALTGVRGAFLSNLVVTSDRAGGPSKEVYSMNWDGTNVEKLTNHRNNAISPNWSPDGKKVAYSVFTTIVQGAKRTTNISLYVLDLITNKRVLTSYRPGHNSGAVFSPDGKHIYLSMSLGAGSADIYKINLNGDIVTRLTKGPAGAINVEPSLSPDGSKVAFSSERGGRPMIYVMNSDGSNVKRLTFEGVYNSSPSWSPDGKKIAFAGQAENHFDIFSMNADGSGLIRITSAKKSNGKWAHNEDPSFSPDSRYIAYTSNRTGKNQIYISSADGTEERRVTNDSYNYYKPKWSRNSE